MNLFNVSEMDIKVLLSFYQLGAASQKLHWKQGCSWRQNCLLKSGIATGCTCPPAQYGQFMWIAGISADSFGHQWWVRQNHQTFWYAAVSSAV